MSKADPKSTQPAIEAMNVLARIVPGSVPTQDTAALVWRLKVQGMDVDDIASITKLSTETVVQTIDEKAQQRRVSIAQSFDTEAVLSLERTDAMLKAIWERVVDGDLSAIKMANTLDESRRKMLGLDAVQIKASLNVEAGAGANLRALSADELRTYLALSAKMTAVATKEQSDD